MKFTKAQKALLLKLRDKPQWVADYYPSLIVLRRLGLAEQTDVGKSRLTERGTVEADRLNEEDAEQ